jgi:ElaB/YqjD/DUF883 family membrane-anchored ribosome-binding protein
MTRVVFLQATLPAGPAATSELTEVEMEAKVQPGVSDATATQKLRTQSETVREDLRELGRITKDVAQEKLGVAREGAREYEDQLLNYVREKPVKSILIAGGVGLALGILLSRR